MSGPTIALITVVHGRHLHFALQQAGLRRSTVPPDVRCVVALDDPAVAGLAAPGDVVLDVAGGPDGLPLAAARNAGAAAARAAGADLLVFLDVDCVPMPDLIERYRDADRRHDAPALLCGPVGYLPEVAGGYHLDTLHTLAGAHPARPDPPPGVLQTGENYDLFWSLSFAVRTEVFGRIGGFCEDYRGYGGEDTDFAAAAAALGIPLLWVGGAYAYHQHHPVSDPPVEHLDAIVRNATVFRRRWGRWPMMGWLDGFAEAGLITVDDHAIARPTASRRGAPQAARGGNTP